MSRATINGRANGRWTGEEGTAVEAISRSWNGLATLVKMPGEPQRLTEYAGRKRWIPTSWLDEEEDDRA